MAVYALGVVLVLVFMAILAISAMLIIAMEGMAFEAPKNDLTTTRLQTVTQTLRAVTDRIRAVE